MSLNDLPKRRAHQGKHAYRRTLAPVERPDRRLSTAHLSLNLAHEDLEAIEERAAYLGVYTSTLIRDVVVMYIQEAARLEKAMGITDLSPSVTVPERYPGYAHDLALKGDAPSHLDGSPLGIEEL